MLATWVRVILFSAGYALAAEGPSLEALQGIWQAAEGEPQEIWEMRQNGSSQVFTRTEGGKVTLRLRCSPGRGECHGMEFGKAADVTMYPSGKAWVHLEVTGANLILRRFILEGKTLMIEVRKVTERPSSRVTRFVRRAELTQ